MMRGLLPMDLCTLLADIERLGSSPHLHAYAVRVK